ncbi:MAG: formate/nitrite transporter family protein [Maricaulaceae bacterium]|nr:formate/nitrite transporter family protein [Maricaulaceae bacterium]
MSAGQEQDAAGPTGLDAYKPAEIGRLIQGAGVAKARLALIPLAALGALAGAFIAFGAMFFLAVMTGADPASGLTRLAAGIAFSLGLILVIVGGAELFTGNALLVMAWVDRRVTGLQVLRNWAVVYPANFAGALVIVALAWLAGMAAGPFGDAAAMVAAHKAALPAGELFFRGVLCNVLVCLAVWLSFAARDAAGKVLVIIPPIAAFVALGFEHSIANMFLLPFGALAGAGIGAAAIAHNLFWVTLGNLVGGAGGVGLSYWAAWRAPGGTPKA